MGASGEESGQLRRLKKKNSDAVRGNLEPKNKRLLKFLM